MNSRNTNCHSSNLTHLLFPGLLTFKHISLNRLCDVKSVTCKIYMVRGPQTSSSEHRYKSRNNIRVCSLPSAADKPPPQFKHTMRERDRQVFKSDVRLKIDVRFNLLR